VHEGRAYPHVCCRLTEGLRKWGASAGGMECIHVIAFGLPHAPIVGTQQSNNEHVAYV
jgi:hypothetical protein